MAPANPIHLRMNAAEQARGVGHLPCIAVQKDHAHDVCRGQPVIVGLPQIDRYRNADPVLFARRFVAAAKFVDRLKKVADQPIVDGNLLAGRCRGKPL